MELLGYDLSMTWILAIGAVFVYLWYDWWCHHYFQRRGIPVADYIPIFGNRLQWREGIWKAMDDYHKKHGKVVGMYDFQRPILIVSEPEFLKSILVKNFSNFPNHRNPPMVILDPSPVGRGMFFLVDNDWRNIRNTLTPSFTAAKMKYMSPLINECCDTLLTSISNARSEGKAIDCRALFGGFTMDVIACCAFGLSVNSQQDKDDPFVQNAKLLLDGRGFRSISAFILSSFPFLAPVFAYFRVGLFFDPSAVKFFLGVTESALKMRNEEGGKSSKRIDLLQLMLNAHNDTDVDQEDTPVPGDGPERGVIQRKPLSTRDIMAQAVQFFLAGYETTNTLLTFTAFVLATNQDVQEKLHAEIDNLDPTKGNLGYDVIGKMEYLDMVISETLRMYPPLAFLNRVCNETVCCDGLVIEKDIHVLICVWNLHHSEEYWNNPYKCDPERFSPENKASIKPYTYLPFGFGPRICFGMRFALLEGKMALVRMLQQYRVDVCSETEIPVPLSKTGLIAPKKLMLNILPRN
ncbi:cytochrome P450 3A24-like [Patiria miniata]|uniref:Thromboxane-A synthase n=2 Tax=Patiria miniata TaxID=46514 RepID=A0A914AU62_PATMI|nr:cytochrome P450 3A24-like [Patiria miniata]